jgi:hypothetical protein
MNPAFILVPAALAVAIVGFRLVFPSKKRFEANAQNGWKNQLFLAREATGSSAEDTLIDGDRTAPFKYPGQGSGQ